jgi:hypothetical protein
VGQEEGSPQEDYQLSWNLVLGPGGTSNGGSAVPAGISQRVAGDILLLVVQDKRSFRQCPTLVGYIENGYLKGLNMNGSGASITVKTP